MLRTCPRKSALLAAPRSYGWVTDKRAVLLQGPHVSRPQVHPVGTCFQPGRIWLWMQPSERCCGPAGQVNLHDG